MLRNSQQLNCWKNGSHHLKSILLHQLNKDTWKMGLCSRTMICWLIMYYSWRKMVSASLLIMSMHLSICHFSTLPTISKRKVLIIQSINPLTSSYFLINLRTRKWKSDLLTHTIYQWIFQEKSSRPNSKIWEKSPGTSKKDRSWWRIW